MASSVNKVILVGNVGRDPEIKEAKNGERYAIVSLATSESWKDKVTGEWKDKTEWHRIMVLNDRIAEFIGKYVGKASRVYIEGKIQYRKWQDKEGNEKISTEIIIDKFNGSLVMLDKIGDVVKDTPAPAPKLRSHAISQSDSMIDDELPF